MNIIATNEKQSSAGLARPSQQKARLLIYVHPSGLCDIYTPQTYGSHQGIKRRIKGRRAKGVGG